MLLFGCPADDAKKVEAGNTDAKQLIESGSGFHLENLTEFSDTLNQKTDEEAVKSLEELINIKPGVERLLSLFNDLDHSKQLAVLRLFLNGAELSVSAASSIYFYNLAEHVPDLQEGRVYADDYKGNWSIMNDWLLFVTDYNKAIAIVELVDLHFKIKQPLTEKKIVVFSTGHENENWEIDFSRQFYRAVR